MRKHFLPLAIALALIFSLSAASAQELGFTVTPENMRPGKMERISFSSSAAGPVSLELKRLDGETFCVIRSQVEAAAGENHLTWDGMDEMGVPIPAGEYLLSLTCGEVSVTQPVSIGDPSPMILSLLADNAFILGEKWSFTVEVNQPGTLTVRVKNAEGAWTEIISQEIPAGESSFSWDGKLDGKEIEEGAYSAQFILSDAAGVSGTARQVSFKARSLTSSAAVSVGQPADAAERIVLPGHPISDTENNYWTLPIGEMDEEAIWNVMMQPMVVIDGNQKDVYRLRKTPDNSSSADNIVGEITYASQGLHILETRDDGWTLVEAYNSSYGPNCASRRGYGVTDDLIRGYVKTSLLKTVTPRTDYALLIDKLNQTMYIFSEGKCIGTLLVSTGLNNEKQSWNETPAGEFVMISKMGGFAAGNLWCAYGMRVNGGCAIHEVPYIGDNDTPADRRDYSSTVKQLGKKASHGCIRVQKAANEQGQNIKWLWENLKVNTKVLIWDDTGRIRPYPVADDYALYYNPNGGKYYHENQYCPSVRDRFLPLTAFTYGELDTGSFAKLTPCSKCTTLMRKSEIDAMNKALNGQ